MSNYSSGRGGGDEVDDFDEYDPTPYGGGYDQSLTYGRPLPPSDEICYPISSGVDYDRPQRTSYSQTSSAYGSAFDRPEEGETYSQPKPDYGFRPGTGYGHGGAEVSHESHYGSAYGGGQGESYSRPQPGYGFSPGMNRPGYGEEAPPPVSEYESGYGGGVEESYSRPAAEYGFRPGLNRPGYGEQEGSEYGSGYGGGQGYGYKRSEEEVYGGGRRAEYERPSYGGDEEQRRPAYGRSGYGGGEEEAPRRQSYGTYGRSEEEEPRRQSYGSYGRSEEEKPRRYGESGEYGRDEGDGYGRRQYDENGNPPGILRNEIVDPIPHLFKVMIKRMAGWHVLPPSCVPDSCIVNIYEPGDCIPPHIDNHDFVRPFCTVSFLSKCDILFGSNLRIAGAGEFSGSFAIPLPVGSVLVLNGNGADVAKHCVPAVTTKRISITFRKMDESKQPLGFVADPDLLGVQPTKFDYKVSGSWRSSKPLGIENKRASVEVGREQDREPSNRSSRSQKNWSGRNKSRPSNNH